MPFFNKNFTYIYKIGTTLTTNNKSTQTASLLNKIPELLSPAGSLEHMRYAFAYGANAVYAGQPRYSLRVRNNDFKLEQLAQGIEEAHSQGKSFFVASNISAHNSKVKTYLRDMQKVVELKPDALIMSDPGLIMLIRDAFPEQVIHLSVQANVVNYASAKFWQNIGVKRIILSRELSLEEIGEIRQECPDLELETFVHGALCIAYSGRCLLSGYMNHRDANQGACTNACRWNYNTYSASEDSAGNLIKSANSAETNLQNLNITDAGANSNSSSENLIAVIEEKTRPDEQMPVYEDEHGTYIMNSKDLRAVQHIEKLLEYGVNSLKIEGRTKSYYYVARTAQIYRKAIDDALKGKSFDMSLLEELDGLSNRGYTEGFYRRHLPEEYQNYETGNSKGTQQQFVGKILEQSEWRLKVEVKNYFAVGDNLLLLTPFGNISFVLERMMDKNANQIKAAPGSGHIVDIWIDNSHSNKSIDLSKTEVGAYALLVRNL